ncbi:MAG: hypothetical protein IJT53_01885 [Prevotella sp.]|nr:hypothetical protein [Prevotella sp.]
MANIRVGLPKNKVVVVRIRGTRYEVRGTRYEVRGTRCEVRGARCEVREKNGSTMAVLPFFAME